jgi:hypothetical protein
MIELNKYKSSRELDFLPTRIQVPFSSKKGKENSAIPGADRLCIHSSHEY